MTIERTTLYVKKSLLFPKLYSESAIFGDSDPKSTNSYKIATEQRSNFKLATIIEITTLYDKKSLPFPKLYPQSAIQTQNRWAGVKLHQINVATSNLLRL